jgi:hypothetical protein
VEHEEAQQVELLGREVDGLARFQDQAAGGVQFDVADGDDGVVTFGRELGAADV